MRKITTSILIMFFIGLLTATSFVNFANTEAYLNGLTHSKDLRHDYDQDGETDSAHTHHVAAIMIIKLGTPKIQAPLIISSPTFHLTELGFDYRPSFKAAKFDFSIFRPPIYA